jgi:hypothetical protein
MSEHYIAGVTGHPIMLSVVLLNVFMLSVMAPKSHDPGPRYDKAIGVNESYDPRVS